MVRAKMNERIIWIYKSILLAGAKITYSGIIGSEKMILILNKKDLSQSSLRIPK